MGQLKPGVTYTYESINDVTYAREIGTTEKIIVGYTVKNPLDRSNLAESRLWDDIRRMADKDKELQEALDRVKVLYYLKYKETYEVPHHPV